LSSAVSTRCLPLPTALRAARGGHLLAVRSPGQRLGRGRSRLTGRAGRGQNRCRSAATGGAPSLRPRQDSCTCAASSWDLKTYRSLKLFPFTGNWDGTTAGEILGEAWYRVFSLPVAENPFFGNGDPCMRMGRTGGVLDPVGDGVTCTVNRSTPILITGLTTECSNAEPPPYYGVDEAAQSGMRAGGR
jgi:hypothetical protein